MKGYAKCHEYHYAEETAGYRRLSRYFMEHQHKFIPVLPMNKPDVIPTNWTNATQQQVDAGTRQSGIKTGFEKWVQWEKDTKAIYQDAYKSLVEMGEPATADFILEYVRAVDDELGHAEREHIKHDSIGYDLIAMVGWQEELCEKYKQKIKNMF